jgi:GNAT superfamily N-acetyltransferase
MSPETATDHSRGWTIEPADGHEDTVYLARLWHHYFGVEYGPNRLPWPLHDVIGWQNEDNPLLKSYGVIAKHDDIAIGGGVASIMARADVLEELPDSRRFDADALLDEQVAWLWFGVVDPDWRGQGIGRRLFERRLHWASEQGVGLALPYGWNRRHGRTSRPLFEANDFVPIQTFDDHYAEHRDACPDCGCWPSNNVDCRCSMTLWGRDLPLEDR